MIVSAVAHGCICSKSTAKFPLQVAVTGPPHSCVAPARSGGLIGRYPRIAATFGMWVLRHCHPRKSGAIPEVIAFIAVIEYDVSFQNSASSRCLR